jgi:hypothetical protein
MSVPRQQYRRALRQAFFSRKTVVVILLLVVTLLVTKNNDSTSNSSSSNGTWSSYTSETGDQGGQNSGTAGRQIVLDKGIPGDYRHLAATSDYTNPDLKTVPPKQQYHVILPCDGRVYHEWQARVFYFWYLRIKSKKPKNMGGFTRILHSGKPDDWMHEIPTVIVHPLPEELEKLAQGYVLLNRPYAVQQWVKNFMGGIPEHFVLLAEPDHLFIRAPPLWATYNRPSAFPFFYLDTKGEDSVKIIQRYNTKGVPLKNFFPVGPSPLMISKRQLGAIVDNWVSIAFDLKQDAEANSTWGWVSEMYAFSMAAAMTQPGGVKAFNLRPEFMAQPPWDTDLNGKNGRRAAIIHYTYSNDFDPEGTFTPAVIGKWHFDKRDYIHKYPLYRTKRPPPGCTNAATKLFIKCINIAARSLEGWKERAYSSPEEIIKYFGFEGDVLDIAEDPDDVTAAHFDDEDYSDDVDLDEIDDNLSEDDEDTYDDSNRVGSGSANDEDYSR